ncbi:hypothetical protein RRG08_039774 [Elysia crispata]|uniref:Uncharacterized protein n=1 Tax=Elysia crispata TaxID=231223 RepID=A0AAE0ZTJ3_9GAST|nr:hypothetical protein RRG08_039774 [Elysia crispata]
MTFRPSLVEELLYNLHKFPMLLGTSLIYHPFRYCSLRDVILVGQTCARGMRSVWGELGYCGLPETGNNIV